MELSNIWRLVFWMYKKVQYKVGMLGTNILLDKTFVRNTCLLMSEKE